MRFEVAGNQENPSDADLVRTVRAGNRTAYGVLVDRHLPSVYAVVARIVCNAADAEDLTQETFLRAFERLHLHETRYSFRNWLLKMATNLALNHLRSRRRERNIHLRVAEANTDGSATSHANDEVPGSSDWDYWLDQLDGSQRAAIVLFHFQEMSYAQIAEVMETPVNTVRTQLHRGRKRLRELMTLRTKAENGLWSVAS